MKTLDDLQKEVNAAVDALAAAINKEFPVGSNVIYRWGKGFCHGTVVHQTTDNTVRIRMHESQRYRVHRKHYSDVERPRGAN